MFIVESGDCISVAMWVEFVYDDGNACIVFMHTILLF